MMTLHIGSALLANINLEEMIRPKQSRAQSFRMALEGLRYFFRSDLHGKIHLTLAVAVCIAGIIFDLSSIEWSIILLCIAAVISTEMINASLERLCDLIQPDLDPRIKAIKDIAAGAVLLVSVASLFISLVIFIPKL